MQSKGLTRINHHSVHQHLFVAPRRNSDTDLRLSNCSQQFSQTSCTLWLVTYQNFSWNFFFSCSSIDMHQRISHESFTCCIYRVLHYETALPHNASTTNRENLHGRLQIVVMKANYVCECVIRKYDNAFF